MVSECFVGGPRWRGRFAAGGVVVVLAAAVAEGVSSRDGSGIGSWLAAGGGGDIGSWGIEAGGGGGGAGRNGSSAKVV